MSLSLTHLDSVIRTRVQQAVNRHDADLRLDERECPDPTRAARACMREWASRMAAGDAREIAAQGSGQRLDSRDQASYATDLIVAASTGLGYRVDESEVRHGLLRCDSSIYLPGDLTSRSREPIRYPTTTPVLSTTLPTRAVEAWAERATTPYVDHTGSIAPIRPGATELPEVGVELAEAGRPIHSWGAQYTVPYMADRFAGRSVINLVAELSAATARAFQNGSEEILLGAKIGNLSTAPAAGAGLDVIGLHQMGGVREVAAVNYATETNMDLIFADLLRMVQSISRGAVIQSQIESGPLTLIVGSRWLDRIAARSNFNGGGDSTGARIWEEIRKLGVDEIVRAPVLDGWGGVASTSAMLAIPSGNPTALRQLVALTPTQVHTYDGPAGRTVITAMRGGGLELTSTIGVGLATATVSA